MELTPQHLSNLLSGKHVTQITKREFVESVFAYYQVMADTKQCDFNPDMDEIDRIYDYMTRMRYWSGRFGIDREQARHYTLLARGEEPFINESDLEAIRALPPL